MVAARAHSGRFERSLKNKVNVRNLNLQQFRDKGPVEKDDFVIGRRIVDITFFGRQFDEGCKTCGKSFTWKCLTNEVKLGLCSCFHFKCDSCRDTTNIYTSDTQKRFTYSANSDNQKRKPFTVNLKAALAIIHAGVGSTHLNAILTTIGLPTISPRSLKKRERDVGPAIEATARKSCENASTDEKNMTIADQESEDQLTFEEALELLEKYEDCDIDVSEKSTTSSFLADTRLNTEETAPNQTPGLFCKQQTTENVQGDVVNVTVSQDAAWSKRGRGMNSLSGLGHVIGQHTKRCLNFSTRKKVCKRCSFYKRSGRPTPVHDCRRNWTKSAKAMEADIAVQLHAEAKHMKMSYAAVVGDEDSSSIKHIREKVNKHIEKFSDIGHIKRSISNKLLDMQKNNKCLTEKVRTEFLKNFAYAVHQNKNATSGQMVSALSNIIPHMYGEHENCGIWCKFKTDTNYKHSNLPHGKDLTDPSLRRDLQTVLQPFILDPIRLLTNGSTQTNESLNNVIWSKNPKFRNYNTSESFDYRCSAAVCQFNDGKEYLQNVIREADLSPRKDTIDYIKADDRSRAYFKSYKSTRHAKRRRIELRKERKNIDKVDDIKLGVTYATDCLMQNSDVDIEVITSPIKYLPINTHANKVLKIIFDIETTKLGYDAEITQLSAYIDNNTKFNAFVLPSGNISAKASLLTGLKVVEENNTRNLFKNGRKLASNTLEDALSLFQNWLLDLPPSQKLLVSHNGNKFDFPVLFLSLQKFGFIESFKTLIMGTADSLILLRKFLPKMKSYSLPLLFEEIFQTKFDSHDAEHDTQALGDILNYAQIGDSDFLSHCHSISSAIDVAFQKVNVRQKVIVFQRKLINDSGKPILSDGIAKKVCLSGLNFEMLKLAYDRNPETGISMLFCEKVDKQVRVTSRRSTIQSVTDFFAK